MKYWGTTADFIANGGKGLPVGTVLDLQGDIVAGDNLGVRWRKTATTGTASTRVNISTFNDATGYQWVLVCGEKTEIETFDDLQTLQPEDGDFPKKFTCIERANAEYLLQPSGYVALAGDVTFANGRVGALQIDGAAEKLWFGVAADGVTDDYSILQSACDRCNALDISQGGTSLISQALELNNEGFNLIGSGLNPLTSDNAVSGGYDLYLSSGADTTMINVNAEGVTVKSLSMYGNANNQTIQNTVAGIDVKATDVDIISVGMYKVAGKGITSSVQANGVKINKCFVKNTGSHGIDMASMPDSACSNSTVLFAGVYGWRDSGAVSGGIQIGDTCRVWGNSIFQTVGDNIYFVGKHSRVFGNRIDGSTRANARFSSASYQNTLTNNEMFDSGVYKTDDASASSDARAGVYDSGTLNTISHNYIGAFTKTYGTESWLGYQTYGVYLNGKKANVKNNTVYDCKVAGIYVNSNYNEVIENDVKYCQIQGIVIAGDENKVTKNTLDDNGFNVNDTSCNIDVIGDNNVILNNYMLSTGVNSTITLTADWAGGSSTLSVDNTSGIKTGYPVFIVLDDASKRAYPIIVGSFDSTSITTPYAPRGSGILATSGNTVKTFLSWTGVKVRPGATDNKILNNTYDSMFLSTVADSGTGTVNSGQTVV